MKSNAVLALLSISWVLIGSKCYYPEPIVVKAKYNCNKNNLPLEKKNLDLVLNSKSKTDSCIQFADQGVRLSKNDKYPRGGHGIAKDTKNCTLYLLSPLAERDDYESKELFQNYLKEVASDIQVELIEDTIEVSKFNSYDELRNWCADHIK